MKEALSVLRQEVDKVANKYSGSKTRRELEKIFSHLEKELEHMQSQRIMPLLRGIVTALPGTAKAVNKFLSNPKVAQRMQAGGKFNM